MYPSLSTEAFFARADDITKRIAKLFGSNGQEGQISEVGYPLLLEYRILEGQNVFHCEYPKQKFYSLESNLVLGDCRGTTEDIPQDIYELALFQIKPHETLGEDIKALKKIASILSWNKRRRGEMVLIICTESYSKSPQEALFLLQKTHQFITEVVKNTEAS